MRKEKLEELESYIEELKVKRMQLLEHRGRFLGVENHLVELNNGEVLSRERLVKNGGDGNAAIILPVTSNKDVILVVQPRVFTREGVLLELPAGYVEKGEGYERAARRELFEETGYIPRRMIRLGGFYQDQGCSGAYNEAYLAEGCRRVGPQRLDNGEFIRYFECQYDEMLEFLEMGFIADLQSQYVIEKSKSYMKRVV